MPYEEQVRSIGPTRTRLINEGKIKWEDLIDRETGRFKTLKELGQPVSDKPMRKSRPKVVKHQIKPKDQAKTEIKISDLEKMPYEKASKVVHEAFNNKFDTWSKSNPNDNLPIAVIPEHDMALIGSKAKVAVLSPYTLNKQIDHHPELTIEDYLKAQDAIERGEKFKQGDKKLAFALDEIGGVIAIFKSSNDGDSLYFTSLWKLSEKQRERTKAILKLSKKK